MAYEILFWLKTLLLILLKHFLLISFFKAYSVVFKNIVPWHSLKVEFAISISQTKRMEIQVDDKNMTLAPADVICLFQTQNRFVAVSFEESHADMGNDLEPSDSQGVLINLILILFYRLMHVLCVFSGNVHRFWQYRST